MATARRSFPVHCVKDLESGFDAVSERERKKEREKEREKVGLRIWDSRNK